jgi:tetratricopeptide (TPR) repeat protein
MSLISDALKAAQRERDRERGASGMGSPQAMLDGFFSVDRRSRSADRRRLVLGGVGTAALLAAVLFGAAFNAPPRQLATAALTGQPVAAPAAEQLTRGYGAEAGDAELPDLPAAAARTSDAVGTVAAPAFMNEASPGVGAPAPALDVASLAVPEGIAAGTAAARPTPAAAPSGLRLRVDEAGTEAAAGLFSRAVAAQNAGQLVHARDLYQQLLTLRPDWPQVHNNAGMVQRALGDAAGAERAYRRAIELDPGLAAAWNNLGLLLSSAGRNAEATAALQHAVSLDPGSVGAQVNLATVLHANGLREEARALLEQASAAAPAMPEVHYALGRLHDESGRRVDAVRHFNLFLVHAAGRFPGLEKQVRDWLAARQGGL